MSYDWVGGLGDLAEMQSMGLWNPLTAYGYSGMPFHTVNNMANNMAFYSVFSDALEKLSERVPEGAGSVSLDAIDADSALKRELDKLGLKLVLAPQSRQDSTASSAAAGTKTASDYQKWKKNYDTVRTGGSRNVEGRRIVETADRRSGGIHRHSCTLRNCVFEGRSE